MSDAKSRINPIDWVPVADDEAKRAWSDFLAKANWDMQVWDEKRSSPDYDRFWKRNGEGILKTLTGGASLEKAHVDVDNDGLRDIVYRATTIRPIDPNNTLEGWAPYPCHGSHPYHSIFFDRSEWMRMGTVATGSSDATADLLRFDDRTFLVNSGPADFGVYEVLRSSLEPTQAYTSQRCYLSVN